MNAIVCACGRRYEYERLIGADKPYWHLLDSPGHDPSECSRLSLQRSSRAVEDIAAAIQELAQSSWSEKP